MPRRKRLRGKKRTRLKPRRRCSGLETEQGSTQAEGLVCQMSGRMRCVVRDLRLMPLPYLLYWPMAEGLDRKDWHETQGPLG